MRLLTFVGLLATATTVLAGVQNYNPTGQGCVDPDGFLACYDKQMQLATGCAGACNSTNAAGSSGLQNCLVGCNGAQLAGNLACWVQSCWNQLYSCESQLATVSYFVGNDLVPNVQTFSWYPPPSDATEGACSCNLGYVYGNKTIFSATPGFNVPCENVARLGDPAALARCSCCEFSFPLSNIYNICPSSDLSSLGIPGDLKHTQGLLATSGDNCAILDDGNQDTCYNTYGYRFRGDKVFNPLNLPEGVPGTEPLSNSPGNAFTEFFSEFTMMLFPGFTSTITPVPFDANAGAVTAVASVSGVATAAATVSGNSASSKGATTATPGTGSSTAAGAAATTSKNSGAGVNTMHGAWLSSVIIIAISCML